MNKFARALNVVKKTGLCKIQTSCLNFDSAKPRVLITGN
jgi:hypothetical protein